MGLEEQRGREMYIDQDVVRRLQDEYGIVYTEGMEITREVRDAIGQILERRMMYTGSLSIGESAEEQRQLEEY